MSFYDAWDSPEIFHQIPNEITTMKKQTKIHTNKTRNKKQSIQVNSGYEYQYVVDELARIRTKQMILEDNMDRSVSEIRNTVAMLSNRILENWDYKSKKNTWAESRSPAWAYPSHTWKNMKDRLKIAIFDNIISKFNH
jgi:uncharacterized protein YfkK (UPF0435 family)